MCIIGLQVVDAVPGSVIATRSKDYSTLRLAPLTWLASVKCEVEGCVVPDDVVLLQVGNLNYQFRLRRTMRLLVPVTLLAKP